MEAIVDQVVLHSTSAGRPRCENLFCGSMNACRRSKWIAFVTHQTAAETVQLTAEISRRERTNLNSFNFFTNYKAQ